MSSYTAFMWGYWGWGNHTKELIKSIDTVERRRGWRPPYFVDIRFRRTVRARGFNGDAFEKTVGPARYKWIKALGNRNIRTGEKGIQIVCPEAADWLLDIIVEKLRERRRVIYFCACAEPCGCHRMVVSKLLIRAAAHRGVSLSATEWPGGEPVAFHSRASSALIKKLIKGAPRVPLAGLPNRHFGDLTALPWCSRIELKSKEGDTAAFISGPAQIENKWHLPVLSVVRQGETLNAERLKRASKRLQRALGYHSLLSD